MENVHHGKWKTARHRFVSRLKFQPCQKRYIYMRIQIERELGKVKTSGVLGSWDLFLFTLFLFSERDKTEMETQTSSHRNGLQSQSIISYWKLPPLFLLRHLCLILMSSTWLERTRLQSNIIGTRRVLSARRFILWWLAEERKYKECVGRFHRGSGNERADHLLEWAVAN